MGNEMAKWVIPLVIVVLVVGGMAIPAIKNVTESDKIVHNQGIGYSYTDPDSVHTLILSAGDGGFWLSSDGEMSYLDGYLFYAPEGKGTASAIGIGVYESYDRDGLLVSQAGVMPTNYKNMEEFRDLALANNTDNDESVFQPWNYYQYTLYKIMATVIMGDSDSQYMMGAGKTAGTGPNMTGLTDSAYAVATTDQSSVCLLLENVWGSLWDTVGETYVSSRVLYAGNTLGGTPIGNEMNNVIGETIQVPSSINRGYITKISTASDIWGTPLTASTTGSTASGESTNDCVWTTNTAGIRVVGVGATWRDADRSGLYAMTTANVDPWSTEQGGTRLSCFLEDSILKGDDYGYVLTTDSKGAVISVQVKGDDGLTDVMPDGTTLNGFWDFDENTGLGPFNCYYVAMNTASGDNADDEGQERIAKGKGEFAYILDPYDLTRTLDGYRFDPSLYNVMLIIPTVYWYSDPDTGSVYMGSKADIFDGITMTAYGHDFTKGDDTGNTGFHIVREFAYGDGIIVSVSDMGEVEIRDGNGMSIICTVGYDNPIQLDISGSSLSYNGTDLGEIWAYMDSKGDHVMTENGNVTEDMEYIIGGYGRTVTMSGVTAFIGYVVKGTYASGHEGIKVVDPVAQDIAPVQDSDTAEMSIVNKGYLQVIGSTDFKTVWDDGSDSILTVDTVIVPRDVTYHNELSDRVHEVVPLKVIPFFLIIGVLLYLVYSMRNQPY